MRSRLFSILTISALAVSAAITQASYAAVQSRVASISTSNRVVVPHTIPSRAMAASDLGTAPANKVLDSVTLRFNMTDAQQAALNQLLIDQQNPSSSRYHQWLTPEQFGAQFGLSSQDIFKVSAWLTSQGLTVTGTARSNNYITVSGSVAQIQQAFGTTIHSLISNGEQHISNITDPVLPSGIAAVVSTISGLHDFALKPRAHTRQVSAPAQPDALHTDFTSSLTGTHFLAPGDIYTIYDIPNPLTSGNLNGTGISIAVVGQVDVSTADVAAFRSAAGLPAYCFQTNLAATNCTSSTVPVLVNNQLYTATDPGAATSSTSTPSTGDLQESQLDLEWAGATAPLAKIIFVNSKDVLNTSLPNAITNNAAPIISISYGLCEDGAGAANVASFNQLFQQANAQGITIVGPAGDSGATDCDYGTNVASAGLAVDFPASSPNVTGVGGTMFNEGTATYATTYWNGNTTSDVIASAKSYIPEAVWNETNSTGLGAGGGGSSIFFAKPTWQTGTGVPSDSARDVPDVSLDAASGHDGYLYCAQSSCTSGFRNSASNLNVVGGTSVATPIFAGILALVQQQIGSRIGNANPTIYGLANSTSYNNVFHDTTTGNNSSPCIAGTLNCPTGGNIGYSATAGYDLATGWGSVDAFNLATKWTSVTPAGTITATNQLISYTTVTTSTSFCGLSAGTLALNVTVSNAGSNSTIKPTGSVQFFVDTTAVGTPVALVNGVAAYTLNTSALTSGGHTVSAAYSGDSTYTASRGTLNDSNTGLPALVDIVSSTSADFSLTPCAASVSVVSGSTASGVTFTITPFHGFTGAVTMSANTADSIAATYSFSVTPVNISSTSGVTTSFVLKAFQTNAQGATGQLKVASNTPTQRSVPWYVAGSGTTLACLLLITLPRRRRWGALLAVILSVAAVGAIGCGSSSSSTSGSGGTTTGSTTNAARGTYTITVTATSGTLVHSANINLTVK